MNRGPSPAELDALTAWWKAQRHIGHAAKVLGRSRQRVVSNLLVFRRLEGAADNVELALKYLDVIEQRWPDVLKRTSRIDGFVEARIDSWRDSERSDTHGATRHNTKTRESNLISLRSLAVPPATVSDRRPHVTTATERGQTFALGVGDTETAEPVALHALGLRDGKHGVRDQLVIREHRVVIPPRHPSMIAAGASA